MELHSCAAQIMTFNELHISAPIMRALEKKNYKSPTPIQEQAIPAAIKGRDILGIAQTGTGKTAAFAIPIIEQLSKQQRERKPRIKALVLTPTRELAIQVDEGFRDYGRFSGLQHTVIFGGVNQRPQVEKLKRGVDILVATPGRLLDLIGQKYIRLDHIQHFVLDEADRMLDMGFIHDIKRLIPLLPTRKQTLFFSATMPPDIAKLTRTLLHNPVKVTIKPVSPAAETIDQHMYFVEKPEKRQLLVSLLKDQWNTSSVLVFSRTKYGADKIARNLSRKGIYSEAIHGNKSQGARQRALSNFKSRKTRVIVATDIAARGIDIANLEMVINYDLPEVAETYVHRIGRTGRAGNNGTALSFCSKDEQPLVRKIQKLTGKRINVLSA